jgi:hypothetical protein
VQLLQVGSQFSVEVVRDELKSVLVKKCLGFELVGNVLNAPAGLVYRVGKHDSPVACLQKGAHESYGGPRCLVRVHHCPPKRARLDRTPQMTGVSCRLRAVCASEKPVDRIADCDDTVFCSYLETTVFDGISEHLVQKFDLAHRGGQFRQASSCFRLLLCATVLVDGNFASLAEVLPLHQLIKGVLSLCPFGRVSACLSHALSNFVVLLRCCALLRHDHVPVVGHSYVSLFDHFCLLKFLLKNVLSSSFLEKFIHVQLSESHKFRVITSLESFITEHFLLDSVIEIAADNL